MKFQDSSLNGLKVGTESVTHAPTHAPTDAPKAICHINFFKVGGIKSGNTMRSGQISYSSKLSCMSSLPASMKWIQSRTAEKKRQHRFTHYKSMGIFQKLKGS